MIRRIALLLPDLAGGGAERNTLRLAGGLRARGIATDLLLCRAEGPLLDEVPGWVQVVPLESAPAWQARWLAVRADPTGLLPLLLPVLLARRPPAAYLKLPALVRYLRQSRPDALIACFPFENLLAIAATRSTGAKTAVIVSEHSTTTASTQRRAKWKRRFLPPLLHRQYALADAIVAVSDGVAASLARRTGLPRARIVTVLNPIVGAELAARAAEPLDHPWLAPGQPPVILGAGRLVDQKDFPTLIRAFARVKARRPARLMVLGQGSDAARTALVALARELGCGDAVSFPGFTRNPFAYMARASVFVLSSAWEGFGNVVAEALACGCPVVSTDCPSGPAEILNGGRFGALVPVGDAVALAEAILATLDRPPPRHELVERAALFGVDRAVDGYLRLIDRARTAVAAIPAASAPSLQS